MMKFYISFMLALLCLSSEVSAQNRGVAIGLSSMWPSYSSPSKDDGGSTYSGSIYLGYRMFLDQGFHAGLTTGIYLDLYDRPVRLASVEAEKGRLASRMLYGWTGFTGMSVTPSWCFDPQRTWTVALALKIKAGKYFGWGSVQGENEKGEQKVFERISSSAGYGIGWSPRLVLERDIGDKSLQLFGGWDSTDPGRGVSRLRSAYYSPKTVDLHGSAITAGAALIF